ncbi:lytic transglycosylase [Tabrizicola sp. TH137]|nr:lytic transglycosylase [Tabrizicola sp. TH137]
MPKVKSLLVALCLIITPLAALAARDTCAVAARLASETEGVPKDILLAITMVETRRDGAPWPWTLNHDGHGQWFASAREAEHAAARIIASGGMADIGCFQINSHWHGASFASVNQMLDPVENARYAARYLRHLRAETGDWAAAIAAYHSRDPDRGQAYLDRVTAQLDQTSATLPGNPPLRRNRFPLFHPGDPASPGTLVPRLAGLSPLVGGP